MNDRKRHILGFAFIMYSGFCLLIVSVTNYFSIEPFEILFFRYIFNMISYSSIITGIILFTVGFFALMPANLPEVEHDKK